MPSTIHRILIQRAEIVETAPVIKENVAGVVIKLICGIH